MSTIRVVIEPAAKQDIREARDYYADKGENTASDFRDELNRAFDLFGRYPEATATAFGRTRLNQCDSFLT